MNATIEIDGLRKRFGSTQALDGMTFTVGPGQVTGFVGPNGAGKSTTMRVIVGLDAPDAGTATITEDGAGHLVVVGRGRVIADTSVTDLIAAASGNRITLRTTAPADAMMVTGSNGVRMQWDYVNDTPGLAGSVSASSPRWLRLVRDGATVTGYDSADGTHWALVGTAALPGLTATVQAGPSSPSGPPARSSPAHLP
jgi:ABC-type phosphonate transport system ATPase subunit